MPGWGLLARNEISPAHHLIASLQELIEQPHAENQNALTMGFSTPFMASQWCLSSHSTSIRRTLPSEH